MKIAKINYTPYFKRAYKRLPSEIKTIFSEREKMFRENCFDPKLKTHKLSGRLAGCWSFSLDYSYRVLFVFVSGGGADFLNVGDHSIYQ